MSRNDVLSRLDENTPDRLRSHFEEIDLRPGDTLARAGALTDTAYLIHTGIAQRFVPVGEDRELVPSTLIGFDGMVGDMVVLAGRPSSTTIIMLTPGTATRVPVETIRTMAAERAGAEFVLRDVAACALVEALEEGAMVRRFSQVVNLARFILRASLLLRSPVVPLTHEALARSVRAHRPGVTIWLQELERRELVSLSRGRCTVIDRPALVGYIGRNGE